MKVKDLLEDCASHFHAIEQDQAVEQALKKMSGYNLSALVVMAGRYRRVFSRNKTFCGVILFFRIKILKT